MNNAVNVAFAPQFRRQRYFVWTETAVVLRYLAVVFGTSSALIFLASGAKTLTSPTVVIQAFGGALAVPLIASMFFQILVGRRMRSLERAFLEIYSPWWESRCTVLREISSTESLRRAALNAFDGGGGLVLLATLDREFIEAILSPLDFRREPLEANVEMTRMRWALVWPAIFFVLVLSCLLLSKGVFAWLLSSSSWDPLALTAGMIAGMAVSTWPRNDSVLVMPGMVAIRRFRLLWTPKYKLFRIRDPQCVFVWGFFNSLIEKRLVIIHPKGCETIAICSAQRLEVAKLLLSTHEVPELALRELLS